MPGDHQQASSGEGLLTVEVSSASLWSAERRPLTIGIVSLVTLFAFEGVGTATAMPVIARDLDALGGYTWAFTAYIVASLFSMVVGGMWCDARGPRTPLLAAIVAFGAGAVVSGLATGLAILVVGRSIQGLGGGVLIVGLYVVIARAYSVDLRPKVFSVMSATWVVPALVGPVIAGWLADNLTWRAVFLLVPVLVIFPAVLLLPTLRGMHDGVPQTGVRGQLVAGGLATVGLFAFQDGVLRFSWTGAAEAAAGVVLLLVGLRPLMPRGALALRRGLPTSVMVRGFIAAAFFSAEVFIPLALVQTRGVSITGAGLVLAVTAVLWFLGSYIQSRLPGDEDRSGVVRAGALLITLGLLTLPLAVLTTLPPWIAAVSWGIGSLGMGLALPSVSVQVLRLSPEQDQGRNSAALQISDSVMSTLAIGLLGVIHAAAVTAGGATPATYVALWLGSAVIGVVAVVVAGRMRPPSTS